MKFLITFREIFMSKTMELATISTQRGFTNGAGLKCYFVNAFVKRGIYPTFTLFGMYAILFKDKTN